MVERDDLINRLADDLTSPEARLDPTLVQFKTELEAFESQIRQPVPPDPVASETECQQAVERIVELGRDLSAATREQLDRQSSTPPAPLLGTLGQYQLLAKLGEGGMGAVYKAVHSRLERVVAIKVLPTNRMQDQQAVGRFQREMRAVGKLQHPNIVAAHDAGEIDGMHYLVMELVEGIDLGKLVNRLGPLPVNAACELIRQAALGLQHAYEHNLVHRDIKPSNLMLAAPPNAKSLPTVKILDLGLALLEGGQVEAHELTSTGQVMGTVDYMAPEQGTDTHSVDIRADIYSLGATLYKLLTGQAPFADPQYTTTIKKLMALATKTPKSIETLRPNCPPELAKLVARMLAKSPEERPTPPEELASLLEPFAAGADLRRLLAAADDAERASSFRYEQTLQTQHTADDAAFLVTNPTHPSAPTTVSQPNAPRPKWRLLLVSGGAIALILGAIIAISVNPGEGTIEIEAPNELVGLVKVNVVHEGSEFKHGWQLKPGSNNTLTVRTGKVDVTLPDENNEYVLVKPHELEVRRGKTVVFTLRRKPPSDVVSGEKSSSGQPIVVHDPEIVESKKQLGFEQPWFDDWLEQVRQMPAEEQVEAVRKKLMELNPGFDGKLTPGIEDGRVTAVQFVTDHVTDLSPVKAFRWLRSLSCVGSGAQSRSGVLQDLSPLKGMSLDRLDCSINPYVVDLSPIIGLPLRDLYLNSTGITDLSQLKGMTLSAVALNCTRVSSLDPLRGMRLKQIWCGGTRIVDLSPLKGAPLQQLSVEETQVADLSPAQGARLESCNLRATNVTDLSALRGMPLADLNISDSWVSDLEPLRGMPLKTLGFHRTRVTDLSPLAGMTLTVVSLNPTAITRGMNILREMKSPVNLNSMVPTEFWAKYDGGEFGTPISPQRPITDFEAPEFQQWASRVAKMPAEKQLEEVRQKLMELNPGFDGKLLAFHDDSRPADIENGVVVGLRFSTHQVTDLSPLRALHGLQRLNCVGHGPFGGVLSDLSPLRGMGLSQLKCDVNLINDLTDLKGLPLEVLDVGSTQVSDLSPLRGMKLKVLEIGMTHVSDLAPLEGMPLEGLGCFLIKVSDLSPLKDAMLKRISLTATLVSDIRILSKMPVDFASLSDTWVSDLSPLSELDLTNLDFTPRHTTKGLEAIRRMPSIRRIGVYGRPLMPPDEFWKKYDDGEFGKPPESPDARIPVPANKPPEIVEAKKRLGFEQPWFDDWLQQVEQRPAEEQVKAVRKKLMELNPGFDGTLTPGIEDGRVASVQFFTDHVTDLSPVKAFLWLRSLSCVGSDHQARGGVLQDLSPLKGMSLHRLDCSINPHLVDLSPIVGLPLRELHLSFTGITDLSQLKGMTLGVLAFSWTQVSSLEPLRGMRLKHISFDATPIADLSPLKGAPLQSLRMAETQVADLSPLQGARLEYCGLRATNVTDLSALRRMPLDTLEFSDSAVSDLEPLRGMPLKELTFYRTRVTDLSPLAGMRLTAVTFTPNTITLGIDVLREMESVTSLAPSNFNFFATSEFWKKYDAGDFGTPISPIKPITDFEAPEFQQWASRVANMPAEQQLEEVRQKLMELNPGFDGKLFAFGDESRPADIQLGVVVGLRFSTRQVTDISPVRALRRLQRLDCGGGVLSNLSPLRGMSLSQLSCGYNLINDLTDLRGLPLEALDVSSTQVSDLSPLRGMKLKSLEIGSTRVSDLSPLQGMPLEGLVCGGTRVTDLSPLNQAMLKRVYLYRASVSDLRVLRGMPLDSVWVLESWVSDLSPLGESDLTTLVFSPTYVTKGLEAIRRMPSIRNIGASAGAQMPPAEFWKKYDDGEFGKPSESPDARIPVPANKPPEIVQAKKGLGFEQPWFDDWLKQLRQMPAEEQVAAVRKKLMELNPGFDGKLRPVIDDGRVISVEFATDHVKDLSPVQAFRKLKSLTCAGSGGWESRTGTLQDLSPLKGMSLSRLDCWNNPNLVELSPISGLPLRELNISVTGVTDLSPLKEMPLETLNIIFTRVATLDPLRGMRLRVVQCSGTRIMDLSPLKGVPLQTLGLRLTNVADLTPLQGAALENCDVSDTSVTDLSALRGMPLVNLSIDGTWVSDLEPLRGMSLRGLAFCRTKVTDLSPLAGMTLTEVNFTPKTVTSGIDILRQMPSVTRLSPPFDKWYDPTEFWQKYDAGDFGTPISRIKPVTDFQAPEFEQWVARVAEMPAEKQLQEVRQKLMELNPGFDGKLTAPMAESRPPDIERGVVVGLQLKTNQVTDISPLRALRGLRELMCDGGHFAGVLTDLSPLRGMGLRQLYCGGNMVRDLTDIKGLPLEVLDLTKTQVSDLSPLREMKLKTLGLQQTNVSDLSPLQGMTLEVLNCGGLKVSDLSPLNEAKLKGAIFTGTYVSDLRPLSRLPLEYVWLSDSWVSDLSPLSELEDLTDLNFTPKDITKGLDAIRQMPSIRRIDGVWPPQMPPAEFWKKYDAGEFGKPLESQ